MAVLAAAPAASASAYGCSFSNPNYGPAQYCVYLSGSGNWVNSVTGNFNGGGGQACSWYITAEFFDLGWNWYQTLRTGVHGGCTTGSGAVIYVNAWKYTGYMCSTLHYWYYSGGWRPRQTSVCHRIG